MDNHLLKTSRTNLHGSAGPIEILVDTPTGELRGIVVITHPHPLQGGNAEHKIPRILAMTFRGRNWLAVRPNFRGVGGTAGKHDKGEGETDDILAVVDALQRQYPNLPLALAGFSFGAFVQARVSATIVARGTPLKGAVFAGMPFGTVQAERQYDTPTVPGDALVIHGEADNVVPVASVMNWARPQRLPIVVVPGANHFFTGYLDIFISIIDRYIASKQ